MLLCLAAAAYPSFQSPESSGRYEYIPHPALLFSQLHYQCSTEEHKRSHIRHPRSPIPSAIADEERLEHGLNGEVLPDPLTISLRPIDSCTANEVRRKIICTRPNASITILCMLSSTPESLFPQFALRLTQSTWRIPRSNCHLRPRMR